MKKISPILILSFGTLILSIIGLYNGYPLVYSDTGTYIASGLKEFVPFDRPITYGLFIKLFGFNYSLWLVIIFQNLITAWVLYELVRTFQVSRRLFPWLYLGILAFLVLFTGLGWYSNQVMPDFFAPLVIIILFILLRGKHASILVKSLLCLVLIFSLVTHFSHLLIGLVIIVVVIILKLTLKNRFKDLSFKRIYLVSVIVVMSWVSIPVINYIVEREFIFSKGNHVFLMAHLCDTGILKQFLDDKCDEESFMDCKLCNYKDSLPSNLASFIWYGHILDSTGGWLGSKEEYNRIIFGTLKEPKYLWLNLVKSLQYGTVQLSLNRIGKGLSAYREGSPPYGQIHWEFHHELNDYMNSRQNRQPGHNLKLKTLNIIHMVILASSLIFILFIFFTPLRRKASQRSNEFLLLAILGVILNSFITAGLNSPYDRFQARVVWIVPLALIIFIASNFDSIKKLR